MKAITAKEFADDFVDHSVEAQRGLVLIERAEGDPLVVHFDGGIQPFVGARPASLQYSEPP